MNFIKELAKEYDELPIQEIGTELKPGMKKVFFPAETRRFVHVSRGAIVQNTRHGKNHPTILVVDEAGNRFAYHAVVLRGPAALKFALDEPGIDANAFLVTKSGIEAYSDPEGDAPIKEVPLSGEEPVEERTTWAKRLSKVVLWLPKKLLKAIYAADDFMQQKHVTC